MGSLGSYCPKKLSLSFVPGCGAEGETPRCGVRDAWRKRDVKNSLLSGLPRPVLQAILVVLEKVFALFRNTISLPAQIERELRGPVSTGKKVEAMKRAISLTGAGLRVSKDYVDQLAKGQ